MLNQACRKYGNYDYNRRTCATDQLQLFLPEYEGNKEDDMDSESIEDIEEEELKDDLEEEEEKDMEKDKSNKSSLSVGNPIVHESD
ncbi:hypothetical protein L211DRAFT_837617 [Terfezia boudieri ATCC MYA-4762]|uniref:Uncharacterized protein n=1 Tax=Terfezia boudieri ATCC MYA-4762 TaxID=1051890 RepID=A0A3N4LUB8_9PEZI|nr:hypothetical protein L211DRAFT_837617 [Terfezia boudieri ATCC MYA-4762]